MNEHEISFDVINNTWPQILQPEFLTWRNKVKTKCIMSLKTKAFDKGATEMFTLEYDKEESLWNVMSEIPK